MMHLLLILLQIIRISCFPIQNIDIGYDHVLRAHIIGRDVIDMLFELDINDGVNINFENYDSMYVERFSCTTDRTDIDTTILLSTPVKVLKDKSSDITIFISISKFGVYGWIQDNHHSTTKIISSGVSLNIINSDIAMPASIDRIVEWTRDFNNDLSSIKFLISDISDINFDIDQNEIFNIHGNNHILPVPHIQQNNYTNDFADFQYDEVNDVYYYRIATDTDYALFATLGYSIDAVANYYYTLIGSVNSIYVRDTGFGLTSSYLLVYTSQDHYPNYDACDLLYYMQDVWGDAPRSVGILLSSKSLGGGCAFIGAACNLNWAYAVNGNLDGYFPVPITNYSYYNWDPLVVSHELGHSFNAIHTHSYNPPVDSCGNGDCTYAKGGTIMSYCHTCSGGMSNIAMVFHSKSSADMVNYANAHRC